MWHGKLRKNYDNSFKQFEACDSIYGIALRLGFKSAKEAWDKNPMIQGSVNPEDLSVVPVKKKIIKKKPLPSSYDEYLLLSDKEKMRLMKQAKQ